MGSIYTKNDKRQQTQSSILWLKYRDATGKVVRQSTGTDNLVEAKRLLKLREGQAASGMVIAPRVDKVTVAELAQDLREEYQANARRSADRLEFSLAHVLPALGHVRAQTLTSAQVTGYVVARQAAGAASATINRELAALKRTLRLAAEREKITRVAHVAMLNEDNARQGFFERSELNAVKAHLPEALRPVAEFCYLTGWRKQEVLGLTWGQVDFAGGQVRLEPGTTKNREGRSFPLTVALRALLEVQRTVTEDAQRARGSIVPHVFHRNGKRILDLRGAWDVACERAGYPGRILHDLRRTAVRNLERAGVSRSVAMSLTGHKTEAVFRRYAIVDSASQAEAALKLDRLADLGTDLGTGKVVRLESVA